MGWRENEKMRLINEKKWLKFNRIHFKWTQIARTIDGYSTLNRSEWIKHNFWQFHVQFKTKIH